MLASRVSLFERYKQHSSQLTLPRRINSRTNRKTIFIRSWTVLLEITTCVTVLS